MSFIGLVFAIILYSVAAAAATARNATAARPTTNNKNVTHPPLRGQGGGESHDSATILSVGTHDKIYDIIKLYKYRYHDEQQQGFGFLCQLSLFRDTGNFQP